MQGAFQVNHCHPFVKAKFFGFFMLGRNLNGAVLGIQVQHWDPASHGALILRTAQFSSFTLQRTVSSFKL
jgi:hypothetical protein